LAGAAVLVVVAVLALNAPEPLQAIRAFFAGPWSSRWAAGNTLDGAAALLCAGLGAALALRAGLFNLGGEGQVYAGGIAAAAALLALDGGRVTTPPPIALLTAAAAACAAGAAMGALCGLAKKTRGANELITTFLLSAAVMPFGDYLIAGPMRGAGVSLLATRRFAPGYTLPPLMPPSSLSVSLFIAAAFALALAFFMHNTGRGYRLRMAGSAPAFARYAGIDQRRYWTPVMAISGALSGLAGFFVVAGSAGLCHQGFPAGLGWNALACALIVKGHSLLLIPACLLYSALSHGADALSLVSGVSFETGAFIQAVLLLAGSVGGRLSRRGTRL
jgi:simple sugar transport system permease protein